MIAPVELVVNAALYPDIAHMRVADSKVTEQPPADPIYFPTNCPLHRKYALLKEKQLHPEHQPEQEQKLEDGRQDQDLNQPKDQQQQHQQQVLLSFFLFFLSFPLAGWLSIDCLLFVNDLVIDDAFPLVWLQDQDQGKEEEQVEKKQDQPVVKEELDPCAGLLALAGDYFAAILWRSFKDPSDLSFGILSDPFTFGIF